MLESHVKMYLLRLSAGSWASLQTRKHSLKPTPKKMRKYFGAPSFERCVARSPYH